MTAANRKPDEWFGQHRFITRMSRYLMLTSADINAIESILESPRIVSPKTSIITEGYKSHKLNFVDAGIGIQYKLLQDGRRQILGLVIPGDAIGMLFGLHDHARFSVMSITEMRICVCPLDAFLRLCYLRPNWAMAMMWATVERASTFVEHIIDAGRRSPVERLVHFLLEFYSRLKAVQMADNNIFELPLSQELIADALGLSAPHVNRILRRLRTDGLLTIDGHKITLTNLEELAMLGSFQPLHLTAMSTLLGIEVQEEWHAQKKTIAECNVAYLRNQLATNADQAKRETLLQLLAEEEALLATLSDPRRTRKPKALARTIPASGSAAR